MGRADRARQERHSRRLTVPRRRPAGAAPSPSSPALLPRLSRAAAACLVGLAVFGFAGTAAQAQTSATLVSNLGQADHTTSVDLADWRVAQGFTTGSTSTGYVLDAVVLNFATVPSGLTVQLATGVSTTSAGTTVATLTNPATLATGDLRFTAPASTTLLANTQYWVVVGGSTPAGQARLTASKAEDAGAAAGWGIADVIHIRAATVLGGFATQSAAVLKMRLDASIPAAPAAPSVSAVPLQPDRLAVSWTATGGATDYDLRYYKGSADPANEADWIEAGEAGGHDHAGTLTQATITGLDPVTTYRVQVRAGKGVGKGPWSASSSGRTEALVGAWGSSMLELVGNTGETLNGNRSLASFDAAQGFRAAGHSLGYTVTDVDVHFQTAPDAGVRVRLATGLSGSNAGTTLATLRNPAALTAGVNTFAAPAGTTLDANATYFVVVEGAAGSVSWTFSNDQDGLLGWQVSDHGRRRSASSTGGWNSVGLAFLIRVNGRENVGDPPGAPGAPTVTAVTGSTGVSVAWSAPAHTGSGITDYDVRYYQGSADPANEADWVEEDETTGLPDTFTADASTSETITGLQPSTAYRVQVRAESHGAPGPWSVSSSVTTNAATGSNSAPTRAKLAAVAANGCVADTGTDARGFLTLFGGAMYSVAGLTDTSECVTGSPSRQAPWFIDPDGDDLAVSAEAVIPDNVRFLDGTPLMADDLDRFFVRAVAAGGVTDVRVNFTATDPHGESVSAWFNVKVRPPFDDNYRTPRFDEMVGTRGFPRNAPIGRWVLPPANGGDMISRNESGQLPYFYAVSGLPPGLSFDPLTRTVTGTPTQAGTYTVTYTADDADRAYSLKDSPTAADLADAARQSFVVQVGAPAIELVRMASAPTYDANNDGQFDTYIAGDTILVDVQFTEPVEVTGTPETAGATPRLRLDVGPSSNSQAANRETMGLLEDGGSLYGGRRLRFGYTVKATDTDPDGVWVQTTGANDVILFVPKGLSLVSKESGAAVVRTFSGLPTSGAANAKVDGSKSSDDIGPQPVSAATDAAGDTVTVTFSRALSNQVDLSGVPLPYYLSVRGAGVVGAGKRDHFQHPNTATVSGGKLVLELNTPVRASDTVTLSYEKAGPGVWPLKDGSSKRVAGFTDLAVANGPAAAQATTGLVGNLGKANFGSGTSLASFDIVQGFTTGSDAGGYVLDAVVLNFASAPSWATVQLATGVSQTSAGTTVATLTNPATLAAGNLRFTAPAGTTLSAGTQYFVVVQGSGSVWDTASKAEDAGAAAGWSIADDTYSRNSTNTGGFPERSTVAVLKMRVEGYANSLLKATVLAPVSANAVGTALELVFNQRLDQDSRPPGSAFTVRAEDVNGDRRTIAGTGAQVLIDGAKVAVTLAAAVVEGELLQVSYAKPAESPLRAAAGSPDVLSFEAFGVEAVHDSTPPKLTGAVFIDEGTSNTKAFLYFDEALDTSSVPAGGLSSPFVVRHTGHSGQHMGLVTTPVVANNAVTFTVSGRASQYWLSYTPPATGGIRDLAGNPAAAITGNTYSKSTAGKPNPGRVSSLDNVDGTLVSISMTRDLDPTSVPDPKWFTLHDTDAADTQLSTSVESVRLESTAITSYVRLQLAHPIHPCAGESPIRVKYTKPTGAGDAKLRGLNGNAASETDTFGPFNVTNKRHSKCVRGSVSGGPSGQGGVQGKSVGLKFDRALDRTKSLDPAYFTVEVPGAPAPSVQGASFTADGQGVTLALSRARSAGETAVVGYQWPQSGQGLWDTAGNQIGSFSGVEVKGVEAANALTASFHGLPDAHDGSRLFAFEIRFSEEFQGMRLTALKRALSVTGGRLVDAKRTVRGENRRVTVRVRPSQSGAVTLALAAPTDCSAADAICASDGRKLSAAVSASVPGPDTPQVTLPVLSVADARADEGGSLEFQVTLDEAAAGDVTVDYATSDGTATAGADYAATTGTLTFAAGETAKTVQVAALSDTVAEDDETLTLALSNPSGATIGTASATGTVANVVPPLTASFHGVPSEHDGKRLFAFEVRFSEEFQGLRLSAFKAGALQVTGGRIVDAKRTARGENRSVTVRVRPSSYDDMTLTLPATTDCTAASAICASDGRKLSETVTATVQGPALLSVADAEVQEGAGAALEFRVTLSRAASGEVTVDYATRDGTATAGRDYTSTRGTLTFAAGELAKTVSVPILDDSEDEGRETLTLKLMNARGAAITDGEATGTIVNSDAVPRGWLARFGRTVAETHVDAVRDRLGADRSPGVSAQFAGQPIPGPGAQDGYQQAISADGTGFVPESRDGSRSASLASSPEESLLALHAPAIRDPETESAGTSAGLRDDLPEDGILAFRSFLAGEDEEKGNPETQALTADDVLLGTSFIMMRDTGTGSSHGVWGRASRSGFSGRDGNTSVDGEVTGVMLGTDWKRKGTIFGMVLSQSRGTGTYSGASSGEIDVTLTGLVPWAGREMGETLSVWGAAGIGRGDMTVTPEGADPMDTGIGWSMAAAGADGALAAGERLLGAGLRWHADALRTRTSSDAATGLAATTGATTRLRLGVTADWRQALESGATLGPRLEAGLRHDSGDAETGFGLEIGGGLGFSDPGSGLSMTVDGRTLALHEDGAFGSWGLSLGLSWDPAPETKRGWSLAARQSLGGASTGGVDALLGPEAFPGLAGTEGEAAWSLEAAYGTGRGNGMVGSPYGRASGTDGVDGLRFGYRIEPDVAHAADASLDLWAQPGTGGNGREAGAGLQWRW